MSQASPALRLRTILLFAAGDLAPSLTSMCLAFFWLYFLIQGAGLAAIDAGLIQGSGYVFSAGASLWAGHWLDRPARTDRGRLLLVGAAGAGMCVSFALMWIVPPLGSARVVWYVVWSWLFHLQFAFAYLSLLSLVGRVAAPGAPRVLLNSGRFGITMFLAMTALALHGTTAGVWAIGRRLEALGAAVSVAGAIGSIVCAVGLRSVLTTALETPAAGAPWSVLARSRVLWQSIVVNVAVWFVVQSVLVLTIFLCAAARLDEAGVMLVLQLSIVVSTLIVHAAVRRGLVGLIWPVAIALWCGGALLWFDARAAFAAASALGLALGAAMVLSWTRVADALDVYADESGVRGDGRVYAALTVLRDATAALVPVLAAAALGRWHVGTAESGLAATVLLVVSAGLSAAIVIAIPRAAIPAAPQTIGAAARDTPPSR